MVPDYGRYYGCVLNCLIDHAAQPLRIRRIVLDNLGFYLLDERVPLYIKFSRNRKGPWTFNFLHEHQLQYSKLVEVYGDCITALVCGKDGIAALNHAQVREILDDQFESQEAVSVRRKLRKMYSVNGTNGKLSQKIGRHSLLELAAEMLGDIIVPRILSDELEEEPAEVEAGIENAPAL